MLVKEEADCVFIVYIFIKTNILSSASHCFKLALGKYFFTILAMRK